MGRNRPLKLKLVLWSTLALQLAGGLLLLNVCVRFHRTRTTLVNGQRWQAKEDRLKAALRDEPDNERLRARALGVVKMDHEDWAHYLDALATMDTVSWAEACVLLANAVLVGGAIYYARSSPTHTAESVQAAPTPTT